MLLLEGSMPLEGVDSHGKRQEVLPSGAPEAAKSEFFPCRQHPSGPPAVGFLGGRGPLLSLR